MNIMNHISTCLITLAFLCVHANTHSVDATPVAATAAASPSPGKPPCTRASYPIPNGNFQTGTFEGWIHNEDTNNVTFSITSGGRAPQGYAARAVVTANEPYWDGGYFEVGGITHEPIFLCPATEYNYTLWYRVVGNLSACAIVPTLANPDEIQFGGGVGTIALNATGTNGQWLPFTTLFNITAANGTAPGLSIQCEAPIPEDQLNNATMDFTDFAITAVESLEPPGCPVPIDHVPNGGFDTGSLAPWNLTSEASVAVGLVQPGYGGSGYAFQANFTNITNPQVFSGFALTQSFGMGCVGYTYELSVRFRFLGHLPKALNTTSFGGMDVNSPYFGIPGDGVACGNLQFYQLGSAWQYLTQRCTVSSPPSAPFTVYVGTGGFREHHNYTNFSLEIDDVGITLVN